MVALPSCAGAWTDQIAQSQFFLQPLWPAWHQFRPWLVEVSQSWLPECRQLAGGEGGYVSMGTMGVDGSKGG